MWRMSRWQERSFWLTAILGVIFGYLGGRWYDSRHYQEVAQRRWYPCEPGDPCEATNPNHLNLTR
jgi:hypothetical protein